MRALAIALVLLAAALPLAAAEPTCAGDAIPIVRGSACIDGESRDGGITIQTSHVERSTGATAACDAGAGGRNATLEPHSFSWGSCAAQRCEESVGDDGTVNRRCDAQAESSSKCDMVDDMELLDLVEMEVREGTSSCAGDTSATAGDASAAKVVRKKPGRTTYANIMLERGGSGGADMDCDGVSEFRKLLDQGEAGDNVALRCGGGGDVDGDGRAETWSSAGCRGTKKEEVERGQVVHCPGHTFVTAGGCAVFLAMKDDGLPSGRSCLA